VSNIKEMQRIKEMMMMMMMMTTMTKWH